METRPRPTGKVTAPSTLIASGGSNMQRRGQEATMEIRGANTVRSGPPGFGHGGGSDPPRPHGAVWLGQVTC